VSEGGFTWRVFWRLAWPYPVLSTLAVLAVLVPWAPAWVRILTVWALLVPELLALRWTLRRIKESKR
jgi:hypothetical protein